MARSINKVTLIGTLGHDPEIKYLPNGNAAARLSLATNESYNDKNTGQRVENTEWHRVIMYGKLAEVVHQYLRKGSKAYFEGKLKTREWEKEGVRRFTTEVIAREMVMLDGKPSADMQNNNASPSHAGYSQPQPMPTPPPTTTEKAYSAQAPQQPARRAATPPPGYRPPANPAQTNTAPAQSDYAYQDEDIPF